MTELPKIQNSGKIMILIGVLIAILPAIDLFMSLLSQSRGFMWSGVPFVQLKGLASIGTGPLVLGQLLIIGFVVTVAKSAWKSPSKRNWKKLIIPASIAVIVPILLLLIYFEDSGNSQSSIVKGSLHNAQMECGVQGVITAVAMLLVILGRAPEQVKSDHHIEA